MESIFHKAILFFSKSIPGKISLAAGCLGLLYTIRWVLGRGIPKFTDHPSKTSINTTFIRQLLSIIPKVIPSATSSEAFCIYALSILVVFRTILSIFVSTLNGKLLKAIVTLNSQQFFRRITQLAIISIPSSLVNSILDFITHKLSIRFRVSLTKCFAEKYLSGLKDFRMIYLDRQLAHDILTEEIDMFSTCLSNLFTNVSKPVLDIALFCLKLKDILGYRGPLIVLAWYTFSGLLLNVLNAPVNRLNRIVHQYNEVYRHAQSNIIDFGEEIAFLRGIPWEKNNTNHVLDEMTTNTELLIHKKFMVKTINSIVSKYGALIIAQLVMSIPAFASNNWSIPILSKDYIKTSSYFVNISKATARLRLTYRNISSLAAYTCIIHEGLNNLNGLKKLNFPDISGKYLVSEDIQFENVSVVTPEGQLLFENMNFLIKKGDHTVIQGPHGCGKSAVFRILGGLWPLYHGTVSSPDRDNLFYLCGVPYLQHGSLEEIFAYPHSSEIDKQRLFEALKTVRLEKLLEKYSIDSVEDWKTALSPKHQQLLGLARVVYHHPMFLILDECTSSISIDLESEIYQHLQSIGVTTITLSERDSILKFHNFVLKLSTEGTWNFYKISHADEYIFS